MVEQLVEGSRVGRCSGVAVLAWRVNELVDLGDQAAGDIFGDRDRALRPSLVAIVEQPCRSGLHEDDVDGMPGRIVQLAGDPGPR